MKLPWALLPCLIVLHSPEGSEVDFDTRHISAFRSSASMAEHLAKGTKSVIFVGGKGFAVTETVEEISEKINNCE